MVGMAPTGGATEGELDVLYMSPSLLLGHSLSVTDICF